MFCIFNYIPPRSSKYFRKYNVDLFYELESLVSHYASLGKVFAIGDFNSRTKTETDFIPNDIIHESVNNILEGMVPYGADCEVSTRINPDQGNNEYGTRLLALCRSTSLGILNGRHRGGFSNGFTFCGANGLSVIDYVLTSQNCFSHFEKYIVCNFNEFSDNAPLHVELALNTTPHSKHTNHCGNMRQTMKWCSDNANYVMKLFRIILLTLCLYFLM